MSVPADTPRTSAWNGLKRSPMRPRKPKEATFICGLPWPGSYVPEEKRKGHETYFRKMVEDTAALFGWITSHSHLPFFDTAGIPDLFLVNVKQHRLLFAELKVTTVKGIVPGPKPAQWRWINAINEAGGDCRIWTFPHDWVSGEIERVLRGDYERL